MMQRTMVILGLQAVLAVAIAGEATPPPAAVEIQTVAGWVLPLAPETGPGNFTTINAIVPGRTGPHHLTLRTEEVHTVTDVVKTRTLTALVNGVEAGPAKDQIHRPGQAILPFGWRGDGSGRYPDAVPPTTFSVIWKLPLHHWVLSSPVIAGDAILTLDHPHRLVCADRATGAVRWIRENPIEVCGNRRVAMGYPRNDFVANTYLYTTPTPVTDGERVYCVFGHGVVACWTLAGDLVWTNAFRTEVMMRSGVSINPCLVGDVLVIGGAGEEGIAGYDRETGRQRWCIGKKGSSRGKGAHIGFRVGDRDLVLTSSGVLVDPADGTILAKDLVQGNYGPSPVFVDGVAYLMDSTAKRTLAWRIAPTGATERLWSGGPADSRSPLVHAGIAYLPGGKSLQVLDATTGARITAVDCDGKWSSPVLFGDAVIQMGKQAIQVFSTGRDAHLLRSIDHHFGGARPDQDGPWDWSATPVADGNRWYHRGPDALWCLAAD